MSETTPEEEPAVPEPTPIERVAQLAAERAAAAMPDYGPRLVAVEQLLAEIREALTAAAGPEGNAAKLSARIEQAEQAREDLAVRVTDLDLRITDLTFERTTPNADR